MAKTIRLASGQYVTRAWGPDGFRFEVGPVNTVDFISLRPTPQEMLDIAALFRRAGLKMRTREEKKTKAYEKPTLTYLGTLRDDAHRLMGANVDLCVDGRHCSDCDEIVKTLANRIVLG